MAKGVDATPRGLGWCRSVLLLYPLVPHFSPEVVLGEQARSGAETAPVLFAFRIEHRGKESDSESADEAPRPSWEGTPGS